MKAEITTTKVDVPANDVLNQKARSMYYLIIKSGEKQKVINVGEKTYNDVNDMEQPKQPNSPNVKPTK